MKNVFVLFLLSSFLLLINTQTIYILESAKEKSSSDKNILSFDIKAGINENIESNINFQIESEFYDGNNYIKQKNIGCIIPKTLDVSFGSKIDIKCSIDLYEIECLKSNKVKFIRLIKNENLEISDLKQNIIGNDLIYEKRIKEEKKKEKEKEKEKEIKADIVFTAESIKVEKFIGNKLIFIIKGQYNSMFTLGFDFELIINNNDNIKSKCNSPNLIFEKQANINCTLIIEPDIFDSLSNGIEINENIYKIKRSFTEEKVLKFKIKNDEKLEIKDFKKNENKIEKEDKEEDKKSEWEIQREIEKRRIEKEKEDEKRKKDQEELENLLKQRQQIEKEQNNKNKNYNYQNNDYNRNNNNYNQNNNNYNYNYNQNNNYNNNNNQNNEMDFIDYNSNVKLIHLQIRYSYDIIYYMFYALTPIPLGHKIKLGFTITTNNYNYGESNKINKNIILKTEEEITPNDKSVIVEYVTRFECPNCKKLVLDKNNIYGAKIYNIPNEEYLLDAININQNGNYLQKSKMISPPLYITENIFNQNCFIELAGNFFNKNKFFISKFELILIGTGYFNANKNVTLYCNLNEREIFSCPIYETLNNFEFKLESLIVNQKENIIIDNSKVSRTGMTFHCSCQTINNNIAQQFGNIANNPNNANNINNQNNPIKNPEQMPDVLIQKKTNWKKILYIVISIIVAYYIISKCFCKKEEDNSNEEYDSRWRVSSANYGGETYGLRNRGW